jgi:predicted nuclease of predicted toxin-antitoxin system
MRFLVDECTGPSVARWLSSIGHDVFSVFDSARGMSDAAILEKAFTENWIIVTSDKDFGEHVFRLRGHHAGIILMRLTETKSTKMIDALEKLLTNHADWLPNHFVVVTETQVRFARIIL